MIEKTKKVNILVIILFLLLIGALGYGGYMFYKSKTGKTITVSGKAEVQITNQISSYSVTVEKHDKDKSKAVEAATAGSQIVVETAKTLGIESKDIKTQSLNVYQREDPYYENGVTKYKPADWYASYTVDITLRDLTKSETLTGALVKIENTTMWGPNLRVDDSKVDEAAILSEAIADARKKAEKLAISSGKKLGEIVSIVEGSAYDGYPLVKDAVGMGGGGGGFAVEPGSSTVSKSVTVTFRLK
jgi:uncharacterized protein